MIVSLHSTLPAGECQEVQKVFALRTVRGTQVLLKQRLQAALLLEYVPSVRLSGVAWRLQHGAWKAPKLALRCCRTADIKLTKLLELAHIFQKCAPY